MRPLTNLNTPGDVANTTAAKIFNSFGSIETSPNGSELKASPKYNHAPIIKITASDGYKTFFRSENLEYTIKTAKAIGNRKNTPAIIFGKIVSLIPGATKR